MSDPTIVVARRQGHDEVTGNWSEAWMRTTTRRAPCVKGQPTTRHPDSGRDRAAPPASRPTGHSRTDPGPRISTSTALTCGLRPLDHRWRQVTAVCSVTGDTFPDVIRAVIPVLPGSGQKSGTRSRLAATVREAIEIHESKDSAKRDTMEAWLLTGSDTAEVARRTGMDADVVATYRDLFFDVAPWLRTNAGREDLAWILLGEGIYFGTPESDHGAWKKFVALQGGEHVLQRYLAYLAALPLNTKMLVSAVPTDQLERMRDLLYMRIYVLSRAPLRTHAQRMRMEVVFERSQHLRR